MSGFQLGGRGRNKAKKVYTADERASYVRQARQLLAKSGSTVPAVAEKLGLHPGTLYTWLRQSSSGSFLPVAVVSESRALVPVDPPLPAVHPVLVSPGGYRVEGLDVDAIADLLRRLP